MTGGTAGVVTRFAPSPTGPLHLGHAFSAILSHDFARATGGRFLLRIEDIDRARSKPDWESAIFDDLAWLGLTWEEPVWRQSERLDAYRIALENLWRRGLLYTCTCTRRDIADALSAPQEGARALFGPDGPVYPGTCRDTGRRTGPLPRDVALRLDMARATGLTGRLEFEETGIDPGHIVVDPDEMIRSVGDVVLARRDFGTSYHLSVVVDDAAQEITHVTRGADLADATRIHVVLQALLRLPRPVWHHHRLIRDESGKRLAKRDDARAIARYREDGWSPCDLRRHLGLA